MPKTWSLSRGTLGKCVLIMNTMHIKERAAGGFQKKQCFLGRQQVAQWPAMQETQAKKKAMHPAAVFLNEM